MTENTVEMRATMSCGYLPAEARTGESLWSPDDGTELTVCAGYTTSLPDVIDCAVNVANKEDGSLRDLCPGGVPKPLIDGCNLVKNTAEKRAAFRLREQAEKNKGGGR